MEYKAIAWLSDSSDFNVDDCVQRLKRRFPEAEISSTSIQRLRRQFPESEVISTNLYIVFIAMNDFTAELYFNEEPDVALQAHEFATRISDDPRASDVAKCHRHVSVTCREEGSIMEYFNDYIFVLETLESFTDVMAFDLASLT